VTAGTVGPVSELPDFHIPHAEKIEWMIETTGWALEPVPADTTTDPPVPGYAYTIGFPARYEFPEVAVFGLTPVASRGLLGLVAELLEGGTQIPLGVPLTGLYDDDLRCVFAPIDVERWQPLFTTAASWYHGGGFQLTQLLWPDRNGLLPYETGFDQRVVHAQPVIGHVAAG
jgi:hypothetical protein